MGEINGLVKYLRSLPYETKMTACYLLAGEIDEYDMGVAERSIETEYPDGAPLWLDLIAGSAPAKNKSVIEEAIEALISQVASREAQP